MLIDAPAAALTHTQFGHLPRSEVFARRYYGRNLDLVQIENAILMAQIGIMSPITDLFRETLRNDPAVSGMVFKRLANLSSCDWDIQAANVGVDNQKAKQIADACRIACLRFRNFRQFLYDMGWGAVDGRAASEIDWSVADGAIRYWPTSHTWIHPGRLSFGPQRELRVVERHRQTSLYYQVGLALNEQPAGKIVQWMPRNFGDYPEREGLAPRILYWMFFKRFSWRDRMTLIELFGLPWRIVETDVGPDVPLPSPEALDDAEAAAENLGAETTAAFEPGMHLKVFPPHPESGTLHSMTAEEVNDEIAKLILMQPKTMTGDTNRAAGVISDKQQEAPLQRDGTGLQECITEQLLRPFVELNYGAENLIYTPTFHLRTDPPRDRKADLERANQMLGMGVPLVEAELYEVSGYRRPKHGEPIVRQALNAGQPNAFGVTKGPVAQEDPEGIGAGVHDAVANLLDAFDEDLLNEPDSGEADALSATRILVEAETLRMIASQEGAPASVIAAIHGAPWTLEQVRQLPGLGSDAYRRIASNAIARFRIPRQLSPAQPGNDVPIDAALTLPFAGYDDFAACVADQKSKGHSDESAHKICGALQAKVEGAHSALTRSDGLELDGAGLGKLLQPSSANGSPEPLIDRGVKEAARVTKAWAQKLAASVEGQARATHAYSALTKAAADLDVEQYARALERRWVHAAMLGALDAYVEMIGDRPIKPAAFARVELAGYVGAAVEHFATKPFAEAIRAFAQKKVVTRRAFDRLAADAKRKAFTIAGQQRMRALEVAHDELTKAIAEGADLGTFHRRLTERFENAGWTPINPSHVETVFRTNVMTAYGDGRYEQMTQPAVLAARPYWQIVGPNDSRTRPNHRAAHGKVLSATDPFFAKGGRPPYGYNCRCRLVSRSQDELDRLGLNLSTGADLSGLPDPDFDTGR